MEINNVLDVKEANKADITEMTAVMKKAFDEDTKRHLGRETGGPPGYDNGEFISKWYFNSSAHAYKVIKEGKIIGGFNLFINENNKNFLGNMFVDPDYQDKGYGTYLWKYIEQMYPNTVIWMTDTPGFSKRNHNFYVNKCGFRVVRIDNPKNIEEESYVLEKKMK
jgi:GNAT superfamily N-acetyltransferase